MCTLQEKLQKRVGNNTIVILQSFPFFFVGKLECVSPEYIIIKPEFGVAIQLKAMPFRIDLQEIAAIFPEEIKGQIPGSKCFCGKGG